MLLRPKAVLAVACSLVLALTLLSSSNSRSAAHSALTNAGIPLPDKLPNLGIKDGFHKWSGMIGTVGRRPSRLKDDLYDDDDFDLAAGEKGDIFEDVGEERLHGSDPLADAPNHQPQSYVDKPVTQLTYAANGYMLLPDTTPSPPPKHPILLLIEKAEKDWKALLDKQSKTLAEAVSEYKQRYKRNPPKGFDKWWAYAVKNKIVLKDEYDQIHRDLQVFWALSVHNLLPFLPC